MFELHKLGPNFMKIEFHMTILDYLCHYLPYDLRGALNDLTLRGLLFLICLLVGLLVVLREVVGPVEDVEQSEGGWEQHAADDVDLLRPELEVSRPLRKEVPARRRRVRHLAVEQRRRRDHGRALDATH